MKNRQFTEEDFPDFAKHSDNDQKIAKFDQFFLKRRFCI